MRTCLHGVEIPSGTLVIEIPCDPCFEIYLDWVVDCEVGQGCLCGGHELPRPKIFC